MILVTGATGTNGRLIVKALLQAGVRELVVADFDRPHTLVNALSGMERSLLLSAVDERLIEREARFMETAKIVIRAGLRNGTGWTMKFRRRSAP